MTYLINDGDQVLVRSQQSLQAIMGKGTTTYFLLLQRNQQWELSPLDRCQILTYCRPLKNTRPMDVATTATRVVVISLEKRAGAAPGNSPHTDRLPPFFLLEG